MKRITTLLSLVLLISVTVTSCSKDDVTPQETLIVKGTFSGNEYEKQFTVDSDKIFTDSEGFLFELDWSTQQTQSFDVDFFADAQGTGGDFETGFDLYSTRDTSRPERVTVRNSDDNTYGKTNINLYSSAIDDVDYTLTIKRLSNDEVVKTVTGRIQSDGEPVDSASLIDSRHPSRSYGFEIIGDFVKVGNKFYFSY